MTACAARAAGIAGDASARRRRRRRGRSRHGVAFVVTRADGDVLLRTPAGEGPARRHDRRSRRAPWSDGPRRCRAAADAPLAAPLAAAAGPGAARLHPFPARARRSSRPTRWSTTASAASGMPLGAAARARRRGAADRDAQDRCADARGDPAGEPLAARLRPPQQLSSAQHAICCAAHRSGAAPAVAEVPEGPAVAGRRALRPAAPTWWIEPDDVAAELSDAVGADARRCGGRARSTSDRRPARAARARPASRRGRAARRACRRRSRATSSASGGRRRCGPRAAAA